MKTIIQPVGKGLGVCLPPAVVEEAQLSEGSELEICVRGRAIELSPVQKPKTRLDDLVAQITDDNVHELIDWGSPLGGEVW